MTDFYQNLIWIKKIKRLIPSQISLFILPHFNTRPCTIKDLLSILTDIKTNAFGTYLI